MADQQHWDELTQKLQDYQIPLTIDDLKQNGILSGLTTNGEYYQITIKGNGDSVTIHTSSDPINKQ